MGFWPDKKVLVTGGAGLIGSYIVEELVRRGAQVRVIDNLSRGTMRNLETVEGHVDFGDADLRLLPVALEGCRGQDVVMHLASPSFGIEHSCYSHGQMLTDTTMIGFNTLEAARQAEVDRVLVVSSSCVYPDNAPAPTPESWGRVGSPEHANQGYGWAKRSLELQARYYQKEYGMDIRVARPFNTYGPRVPVYRDSRDHLLVALIAKAIKNPRGPLEVWGSGDQTRAMLHADTVAKILIKLTEGPGGETVPVNVGSGMMIPVKEWAKLILTTLGIDSQALLFDPTRPEGTKNKGAECTRLKTLIGDFPESITFKDGITELCAYVRGELARQDD